MRNSNDTRWDFFLIFAFILQMFVTYYNRSGIDKPEIRKM